MWKLQTKDTGQTESRGMLLKKMLQLLSDNINAALQWSVPSAFSWKQNVLRVYGSPCNWHHSTTPFECPLKDKETLKESFGSHILNCCRTSKWRQRSSCDVLLACEITQRMLPLFFTEECYHFLPKNFTITFLNKECYHYFLPKNVTIIFF